MDEAVTDYYANEICNLMHQYPDNQVGQSPEWMFLIRRTRHSLTTLSVYAKETTWLVYSFYS
jgi:hypothetical protein